jgi:OOP family OmpA-OmpF porin
MKQRIVAFSFLVLLTGTAPAAAQRSGSFEVSGAAGYHTFGSATELDGAVGVAGRLGFWVYGPISIEGEFNSARPRTTTALEERVTVNTFAGWLLGNLPLGSRASAFLKGGFGSTSYGNCPDVAIPGSGPCGSVGVLQGGAGARINLIPNLSVRFDGVINTSTSSRKFSNAVVQGGLSYMLGGASKPKPREADFDGDGVIERLDHCPGTPRGARVDARGCSLVATPAEPAPAPAVPPPPVQPKPEPGPDPTPAAPVAPRIVPDTVARKDTTAKPARARVVILPGETWNYRSSSINATAIPALDALVATLRENASLVAEVQGYAQDRLVPSDNTLLSTRRAEAIKSYIVSKGVTADRLSVVGLGSQTLIVADTTDAARITNRRVEVHLRPRP